MIQFLIVITGIPIALAIYGVIHIAAKAWAKRLTRKQVAQ